MSWGITQESAARLNGALRTISINHRTLAGYLLEECGIHAGQEWVLQALQESSPRTNAELAAWSGCEPPTVTNTVAKLQAAGLLTRTRRATDARVVDVSLTELGRERVGQVDQAWIALAEDTAGDLSEDEVAELTEVLERLAARLRARREDRAARRR